MKKLSSILLCLLLCMSVFAVGAFADETEAETFDLRLVITYSADFSGEMSGGIAVYDPEDGSVTEYTEDTVFRIPVDEKFYYSAIWLDGVLTINAPVDFDLTVTEGPPIIPTGSEQIDGVNYTVLEARHGRDTIVVSYGSWGQELPNTTVRFVTEYPAGYEGEDIGGVEIVDQESEIVYFRAIGTGATELPGYYGNYSLEAIPLEGLVGSVTIGEGECEVVTTYTDAEEGAAAVSSGLVLSDVTGVEFILPTPMPTPEPTSEPTPEPAPAYTEAPAAAEKTDLFGNSYNILLLAVIAAGVVVIAASVVVIAAAKKKK